MSFSIERAEDGIHFEVKDDTSTEPHDSVWATCDNEMDAFAIATAMNIMDARERKGTPWEILSSVQAEIIGAMEKTADDLLTEDPFGQLNRQCKYCSLVKPWEGTPVHRPTCLISVVGEWKIIAEDRLNEAIRRSRQNEQLYG